MKKLIASLIIISMISCTKTVEFKKSIENEVNQAKPASETTPAITLTGTASNGIAHLTWVYDLPFYTIHYYLVQRKENAGNLQNYWASLFYVYGTDTTVQMTTGKNIFRIAGFTTCDTCTDGGGTYGVLSNTLSLH